MKRALLAALLLTCPAAWSQPITLECNQTHCLVPIPIINALIAQSKMNCGSPTR